MNMPEQNGTAANGQDALHLDLSEAETGRFGMSEDSRPEDNTLEEMREWLCEQALKDGETILKEQDVIRQRHLSVALSLAGWAQPVMLALIGVLASTNLTLPIRAAAGGTLVFMLSATLFAFRVQKVSNWIAPAHQPSGWLKNLSIAEHYTRLEFKKDQAERLQSIIERNRIPLRRMEFRVTMAQRLYVFAPWAGLVCGVIALTEFGRKALTSF